METNYTKKNRDFIYLLNEYRNLVSCGKNGKGMDIMHSKIIELESELRNIDKMTLTDSNPYYIYLN